MNLLVSREVRGKQCLTHGDASYLMPAMLSHLFPFNSSLLSAQSSFAYVGRIPNRMTVLSC